MNKQATFWIKCVLSVLLLGYLIHALDLTVLYVTLKHADWPLVIAATICLVAGQVISALRWTWLARGLGLQVVLLKKIQL